MTVTTLTAVDARQRRPVAVLAAVEARRNLRSGWLWAGVALSAWMARPPWHGDWQADTYQRLQAASVAIALALFVVGVGAGGRDHVDGAGLAEDAPLGADDRAAARLLGLVGPWLVGVVWALVVFTAVRIRGGLWIGDWPRRTDGAQYSAPEMLQPVLLFAVTGAAGVAVGRACRHRVPVVVAALMVSAVGFVSWMFQAAPIRYVTPVQTQPFVQYVGPPSLDPSTLPADWLLAAPDRYSAWWGRVSVDAPLAAWHDVYLAGLALVAAGLAVRGAAGRRLVAVGALAVVVGIVVQVVVAPGPIDLAAVV